MPYPVKLVVPFVDIVQPYHAESLRGYQRMQVLPGGIYIPSSETPSVDKW